MENSLKEINAVLGVVGSFICLSDGTVAAKALPDRFDAASVGSAARVATQTTNALETSGQRIAEADLVYAQGRLVMKNLRGGILVIVCARSINIPLLNLTANVIAKKISAELKAPKPVGTEPARKAERPVPIAAVKQAPVATPTAPVAQAPASVVTPTPLFVELEKEMHELTDIALASNIRLVAMSPIAVWERCPRNRALISKPNERRVEFLGQAAQAALIIELFERRGHKANQRFNAFHGSRRLNFLNAERDLIADVFLDAYDMYHHLDLRTVAAENERVLPVTALLLLHLQRFEMNDPVFFDLCVLLMEHDLSVGPEKEKIDASQITRLCADDWGWYKTVMMNLNRVEEYAARVSKGDEQAIVIERAQRIKQSIEGAPKSLRWQTRARIGESVRWYDSPISASLAARPDLPMG